MLPKRYRLPKEKFQKVYKEGKKLRGKYGMLVVLKKGEIEGVKLGIVVSKKIGNAVQRHRMTRLVRSVFLESIRNKDHPETSTLLQYIAFEYQDNYKELKKELGKQLSKAFHK